MDFLFPQGKVWTRPPTVGIDVMRHPCKPSIVLLLLCLGVGCVILRLRSGESIPKSVSKFLSDERIHFVGFGIPEKEGMFPFKALGLTKNNVDIGYLAAKVFNDPKYKSCDLSILARKVLRIKNMVGLTESSTFERHQQIICAICHLFVSRVTAMTLLGLKNKKRSSDSPITCSFINTLNSLPLLNEGWFKLPKAKKDDNKSPPQVFECNNNLSIQPKCKKAILGIDFDYYAKYEEGGSIDDYVHVRCKEVDWDNDIIHVRCKEADSDNDLTHINFKENDFFRAKDKEVSLGYDNFHVMYVNSSSCDDLVHDKNIQGGFGDDSVRDKSNEDDRGINLSKLERLVSTKKQIKGILKCPPSSGLQSCSPSPPKSSFTTGPNLKRANSKGYNVSFK
ncbi:hypothetical protein LguiA_025165 [Lonicera macranthoides]